MFAHFDLEKREKLFETNFKICLETLQETNKKRKNCEQHL